MFPALDKIPSMQAVRLNFPPFDPNTTCEGGDIMKSLAS
jgi:hypothetical protein